MGAQMATSKKEQITNDLELRITKNKACKTSYTPFTLYNKMWSELKSKKAAGSSQKKQWLALPQAADLATEE